MYVRSVEGEHRKHTMNNFVPLFSHVVKRNMMVGTRSYCQYVHKNRGRDLLPATTLTPSRRVALPTAPQEQRNVDTMADCS
jgi:hypothetical protein